VLACRYGFGDDFERWAWRVPFLLSIILLAISVYIRLKLEESPVFVQMQREGTLSRAPLREAFGERRNARLVLLVLLGAVAGQAVVAYGSHLYAFYFLERILRVDALTATLTLAAALLITTPLVVLWGWLSDRVGRKVLIVGGCLLAASTYFPAYHALTHFANPALELASAVAPVTVVAPRGSCSLQLDPIGRRSFTGSCDVACAGLARAGIPYETEDASGPGLAHVRIGAGPDAVRVDSIDGAGIDKTAFQTARARFDRDLLGALGAAGYPARADPESFNASMVLLIVIYLCALSTMTYGPLAAWLVETFPPRIRYSALSLPYHIGNGWVGGFLPFTAFAIVAATGDIYSGLWYIVLVSVLSVVVGGLWLRETVER
jgi:hypothetical protein